ncbi:MAG: sulfatase [Pirellulales bacterium]|nr:sulfatase [Pirellulales bacterium]
MKLSIRLVSRTLALAITLFQLPCAAPASAADEAPRPNIVLCIADDWGWPHASAYGDAVVGTATFDRIAREGVLFEQAFVSSPSCTPSRGAIITGQQFWRLGAGGNLHCEWPADKFAEYPRLLADAGYHVGTYRKAWGPGRGNPAGKPYKSVDAFLAARPPGKPLCFWFGSTDPHRPYEQGAGARAGLELSRVHLYPQFPDADVVRNDVADYYFEIERFDHEVGELLEKLAALGELDNTLVVMTSDHGMPFPRGKTNLYDCGVHVPLAIRWPARVPSWRKLTDFVSLTDLAPTFLAAAGVAVPAEMTGRSLLPILESDQSGRVDPTRNHVLVGRERHVQAQEAPEPGGYPMRAVRSDDYLYIRNFKPERWPAGTPDPTKAFKPDSWLADCDNGPTKRYLWDHREEPGVREQYELCFGKRPAEELYDLLSDPGQMKNVAGEPAYAEVQARLSNQLESELRALGDPRVDGGGDEFDTYPYYGGGGGQWSKR